MQDRYSGDVGDFSKFSLLKGLFSDPTYRHGLIWYLYPDEDHNTDGRYINYVHDAKYKSCDLELINKLTTVTTGERSISHLEELSILPSNTVYYSAPIDFHLQFKGQSKNDKLARHTARLKWIDDACKTVSNCNVLCLDPDNGLQVKSVSNYSQSKSGKYTFYSEILKLYENKKACVIYQHLNRTATHEQQIKIISEKLKSLIPEADSVFALRFSPYSPRAYFILVKPDAVISFKRSLDKYLSSPCGEFWDSLINL